MSNMTKANFITESQVQKSEEVEEKNEKSSEVTGQVENASPLEGETSRSRFAQRHGHLKKHVLNASLWAVFTAWWIVGLVRHREYGWLIPFLIYLGICLRIIFNYVPSSIISNALKYVWNGITSRVMPLVPEKWQQPIGAAIAVSVILVAGFVPSETPNNSRKDRAVSLFGLCVFIGGLYATSHNRKKVVWRTVVVGMLTQFLIALFVLRSQVGFDIFRFVSNLARSLLGFSAEGLAFLTSQDVASIGWFLTGVTPAIIFFVSLVNMLYYWGFMQWFIRKIAVFFRWAMQVSGAEATVAAASPFVGQGESAILIKPFIQYLTKAEIHQVLCSGFSTIAGSVLVAYISLGVNPQVLVSSCIMSIPASLAMSKLRYPEEEQSITAGSVVIPEESDRATNTIHAFAKGAWLGLKIAGMVVATLLCIIALLALVNALLSWWGKYWGFDNLTLQLIMGYVFYPVGVTRNGDLLKVGQLIGIKVIANEFVAYHALITDPQYADLSSRSYLIASYALCGFGNIGTLGAQVGVLSQLAPERTGDISKMSVSALIAGIISTLSSAGVAGLVLQG